MLKTSTTQTQLTKNMKTEAIKAALANLDKTAALCDLPDSEFVTGGSITTACRAAGYDESGRATINQMNVWSSTVGELETMLCEQEEESDYSEYSVKISSDPSYYGNKCTQQDADRIAASLADLIRSEFPGIDIVENDLNSKTTGPDETVIEEINTWIEKNWTAAL
jgi:hypothetical protein